MSDVVPNPQQPTPPSGALPPPFPVSASPVYPPMQAPGAPGYGAPASPRSMYTAAAILNWVTLGLIVVGTLGFGIVAAAWFVPMTIYIHKAAKDPYKHTALGVCTLLFCNLIGGILMLVDDSNRPDRPLA